MDRHAWAGQGMAHTFLFIFIGEEKGRRHAARAVVSSFKLEKTFSFALVCNPMRHTLLSALHTCQKHTSFVLSVHMLRLLVVPASSMVRCVTNPHHHHLGQGQATFYKWDRMGHSLPPDPAFATFLSFSSSPPYLLPLLSSFDKLISFCELYT